MNPYKIQPASQVNSTYDVYKAGKYVYTGTWGQCRDWISDDRQSDQLKDWQPKDIDPLLVFWSILGIVAVIGIALVLIFEI